MLEGSATDRVRGGDRHGLGCLHPQRQHDSLRVLAPRCRRPRTSRSRDRARRRRRRRPERAPGEGGRPNALCCDGREAARRASFARTMRRERTFPFAPILIFARPPTRSPSRSIAVAVSSQVVRCLLRRLDRGANLAEGRGGRRRVGRSRRGVDRRGGEEGHRSESSARPCADAPPVPHLPCPHGRSRCVVVQTERGGGEQDRVPVRVVDHREAELGRDVVRGAWLAYP